MNIYVKVNGQNLRLHSNFKIVTGSANFIKMIFTLTSDWDDMLIKAVYTQMVDGERLNISKPLTMKILAMCHPDLKRAYVR